MPSDTLYNDVFISYSRKDVAFARRMVETLQQSGRKSWIDWGDLSTGARWWGEIQGGIEAADNFVFLVTPDSLASPVCHLEIAHARGKGKRIVPIIHIDPQIELALGRIAAVKPDATLDAMLAGRDPLLIARDNWRALSEINWIFFRENDDFQQAFDQLVKTIETDPEHVRQHTRLLIRAREWEANQRRAAYALRGDDLRQAEIWLAAAGDKDPQPTPLHQDYIVASRIVQAEEDKRLRNLTQARFGLALAIALVVLLGFVFLNLQNNQQTEANQSLATQVQIANDNAAAALANLATSDARGTQVADSLAQAQSLAWAAYAEQRYQAGDTFTALSLALEANRIPNPSLLAHDTLAEISYAAPRRHFSGHSGSVWRAVFSPDGNTIISGGDRGELILWDVVTGNEIRRFSGHSGVVYSAAFSPDGNSIISGGDNGELILWDVHSGREIRRFPRNYLRTLLSVAFSPDGRTIIVGGFWVDNESPIEIPILLLEDAETGEEIDYFNFTGLGESVRSVAFSPEGRSIISGGSGFRLRGRSSELILWDVESSNEIHRFSGYSGNVTSTAFSPDGHTFISSGGSGELILWDVEQGNEIRRFSGHSENVTSATFGPDGNIIISGGSDGKLILWDASTGREIRRFSGHSGNVTSVAFSPDGSTIISGDNSGELLLWDIAVGSEIHYFSGHTRDVSGAAFGPDGKYLISSGEGGELILWDVEQGSEIRRFSGHNPYIASVLTAAFSPDGSKLVSGGDNEISELILWDVEQGSEIHRFSGHSGTVYSAAFSPDGKTIISGGSSGEPILWDVEQGSEIRRFSSHSGGLWSIAFSPDGKTIISRSNNSELILWEVASGSEIHRFSGHSGLIFSTAFSPDGSTIISGGDFGELILWDVATGSEIHRFSGHSGTVYSAAFSPDGSTIISGGDFGELILWDVATGSEIHRFSGHSGRIYSVAFSPNGRSIVSGGEDGELILWRVDTLDQLIAWTYANRAVEPLTCQQRLTYNVPPLCDANGLYPTSTPYLTWTPSPTATATP